ncbi:MAG: hypothetical protein LAN71_14065 [Acidobacteriia bacterium]|nr:hypothetical protein [Terriglobia bacterium]
MAEDVRLLSLCPVCFLFFPLFSFVVQLLAAPTLLAQEQAQPHGSASTLYKQLQAFELSGGSAQVNNLVLQRDRATITFSSGTFYFPAPVLGHVPGAVFIGSGTFRAEPPPVEFERDNLRRLLKADVVESDFKTAVLRFTDDTFSLIGKSIVPGASAPEAALKLAAQLDPRILEETGANLSARQMVSILNQESPGFFFAQFDGGHRKRFSLLLDPQARIPVVSFGLNAGEKGLIFSFDKDDFDNDVWLAFAALDEYRTGKGTYADSFDFVDAPLYTMNLDLREPKKFLSLKTKIDFVSRNDHLLVLPLALGEGLSTYDSERRKKQLRVSSVRIAGGDALEFFQEPWEEGLAVVLPVPVATGGKFTLEVELSGEFMFEPNWMSGTYFPLRNTTWYPRHGYLQRSRFDVTFLHRKNVKIVSGGLLVSDDPPPDSKDERLTRFRMDYPIALISFAAGVYELHAETTKLQSGKVLPVEFYSMPGSRAAIKEDFILAEMENSVRYFSALFGDYPYPVFRAVYHPFHYGQGLATLLRIPAADRASKFTYKFIAHETAHQWWGNVVAWRSYRDQWLSEGFAEYSGLLYTQLRDKTSSENELIEHLREQLKNPPRTLTGVGKGRLVDVGPLILGHRLSSRETFGAYTALTYNKGALVLRMLHFLFTDPATGDGSAFFEMMSDFVKRYANSSASTEDFFAVANEHVKNTPLAKRYGYKDLNWFYRQWVWQSYHPSYRLGYSIEDQPDGTAMVTGTITQEGLPEDEKWFMPLPVVITLGKDKIARGTIAVMGKQSPVKFKLPARPSKVELDPGLWVLSDKTTTNK